MPTRQLRNYLRTHRKRLGFTQQDIAFLIGAKHGGKISLYEKCSRMPRLATVLAYEVVFQVTPREMFGELFEKISLETRERADALIRQARRRRPTRRVQTKIDHLKRLGTIRGD